MTKFILVLILLVFTFPYSVQAIYEPLSVPNNKYGIHIIDENDLESAAHLVNSSGGDWGYVTMVITQQDKKFEKWAGIFENLAKFHLIPIVRIATAANEDHWLAPEIDEINNWVDFLDKLPWPVKNRYITVYNEPNHAKEWGGKINPAGYAKILSVYSDKLKAKSADFFILPAGLDSSAPDSPGTMDQVRFIKEMLKAENGIFDKIDGWTSHSYPNPNFTGRVTDRGRGTIANFVWEINLLKNLGISKTLPVFITETGWLHNGNNLDSNLLSPDSVAENILMADELIWQKYDIVALSPFLLNYQSQPFSGFSWQKLNSGKFYPQYDAYRSILKINGKPVINKIEPSQTPNFKNQNIQGASVSNSNYSQTDILYAIWTLIRRIIG